MKIATVLLATMLIVACVAGRTRPSSMDRITECNAGSSYSLTTKLEAKIAKNLADGVSANAGIEEDLKGHFINNAKVTEANAIALYGKYLQCLNTPRP